MIRPITFLLAVLVLVPQIGLADYTQKFVECGEIESGWETWNLSGEGVSANDICEIICVNKATDTYLNVGTRTYGSTLLRYIHLHEAEGGGVNTARMHVEADASSRIEIWAPLGDRDYYLVGYWDSGSYTEQLPDTFTIGSDETWTTTDISPVPANKVAEVMLVDTRFNVELTVGVREVGSSLDRFFTLHEAEPSENSVLTLFVKTDASQQVQFYASDASYVEFQVIGYWDTDPGTWTEKMQLLSLNSADSTWEDEDLTTYITDGAVVELVGGNSHLGEPYRSGMRENGSSDDRKLLLDEAEPGGGGEANFWSCHVTSDVNGIVELWVDYDVYCRHWLTGQWVIDGEPPTYRRRIIISD